MEETNDMPHNFWDYGINPILGYRYMPDERAKPASLYRTNKKNIEDATT
jgi:hypothetical protein